MERLQLSRHTRAGDPGGGNGLPQDRRVYRVNSLGPEDITSAPPGMLHAFYTIK